MRGRGEAGSGTLTDVTPDRYAEVREGPWRVASLQVTPESDPARGVVRWDPARSIWNAAMLIASLLAAPFYFSWSGVAVCFVLLGVTMCTGHSVGFHRRLIHRTFECPKWLDRYSLMRPNVEISGRQNWRLVCEY